MPRRTEDLPEEYEAHSRALAQAIGTRIRTRPGQLHLRQEQVRTQMELQNVYVSRARFSRIETGDTLPNAAEIIAVGDVLQCSHSWLLSGQAESISEDG